MSGLFTLAFVASGLMMPAATVLALHPHESAAGTAPAVLGTTGCALGALASALVTALADGTAVPTLGIVAACALCFLIAAWFAFFVPRREHGS